MMKILCLSQSTIGQLSIGHIINLASNDVQKFELVKIICSYTIIACLVMQGFDYLHTLWVVPLIVPIFTYVLWRDLGPSCLAGMSIVILQPPVQYIGARLYTMWRYILIT